MSVDDDGGEGPAPPGSGGSTTEPGESPSDATGETDGGFQLTWPKVKNVIPQWLLDLENYLWFITNPGRSVAAVIAMVFLIFWNTVAKAIETSLNAIEGAIAALSTPIQAVVSAPATAIMELAIRLNVMIASTIAGTGPLGQVISVALVVGEIVLVLELGRRLIAAIPVVGGFITA